MARLWALSIGYLALFSEAGLPSGWSADILVRTVPERKTEADRNVRAPQDVRCAPVHPTGIASSLPLRLHWALHGLTAAALGLAALVPSHLSGLDLLWPAVQPVLSSGALVILGLGALRRIRTVARCSSRLCLALLALTLTIGLLEGAGRLAAFDWSGSEAELRRVPPFYRLPTVPIGDGALRRPGPEVWTGQPIRFCLNALRLPSADYASERVITVRYDAQGFRNEPPLDRWRVAVAGDSFTELGQLPFAALFTTLSGRQLGVAVRNLGVSHTGPLTQIAYLEQFGLAPDTSDLVLVFAEANDLDDLGRELALQARDRRSTEQRASGPARQTSLLAVLCWCFLGPESPPGSKGPPIEGWFPSAAGWVPLSLASAPPSSDRVSPELRQALGQVFERYRALADRRHVRPWVAFMPCKERVLHGQVRFVAGTVPELAHWQPTDLPAWIGRLCDQAGLRFLDLTPALVAETRDRRMLLYEGLYDTHLNAAGSAVVARTLANALQTAGGF
jgi:hypothetical protein